MVGGLFEDQTDVTKGQNQQTLTWMTAARLSLSLFSCSSTTHVTTCGESFPHLATHHQPQSVTRRPGDNSREGREFSASCNLKLFPIEDDAVVGSEGDSKDVISSGREGCGGAGIRLSGALVTCVVIGRVDSFVCW